MRIFDNPDEFRKAMQAEADRHRMAAQAFVNDVKRLFEEQSPDNLATLTRIFQQLSIEDDPASMATYYEGTCTALLVYVHGRCTECLEDHGPEDLLAHSPTSQEEE